MLRTSTARLFVAAQRSYAVAPRAQARAFSRTSPALVRIRKADGSTSKPADQDTPASPAPEKTAEPVKPAAQPTPAPQPSSIPEDVGGPPPFEPEVSKGANKATADAKIPESEPLASAVPPSEPPAPEASAPAGEPDFSKLPSLDIDPEANAPVIEQPKEEEKTKKGPGAKKRPQYESSMERRRKLNVKLAIASLVLGSIGTAIYVGEKEVKEEEKATFVERVTRGFEELKDFFFKPAFKQLLPDPLPAPYGRPYTLLVDLEDMLVHATWDRQHGWRTAKRPGVDYFLSYLSQFYEIVLFTTQPSMTALAVAEKLDPYTLYIPYKLCREATGYVDGHVVKDLSYLNRDLSKVVLLDTVAENASLQPDNAVIIPKWDGSPRDRGLVEMIPFLESIGIYAPADVRPVLKHYAGKDIPREFAKQEAEMKAAAIAEWERTHPIKGGSGGSNFLSGVFGGSSASQRPRQPMTYLEIKREQAQKQYQEEQKFYKEQQPEIERMIEEDKQRMMAEHKGSLFGMFGGVKDAPKEGEAAAPTAAQ